MGNISVSLPSDGTTADVSDYNTPITTIVSTINGGLDNANIASGAAIAGSKLADGGITNAKLATGSGEPGGAWTSWTPSWTNLTVGNGTLNYAKYTKIGNTVKFRIKFTLGSTSAVTGPIRFSAPVSLNSQYSSPDFVSGDGVFVDTGTAGYVAWVIGYNSTTIELRPAGAAANYVNTVSTNSTVPHTWANTDVIQASGEYEAA